jgi:RNA polymerase sigma-70 factor (ECF subfamily)
VHALGEVFDRVAPDLFRLALFLAPDASDAEDLVQETFLTAIRCAHSYAAGRPPRPWLLGILGNHARHARRRRRFVAVLDAPLPFADADPASAAQNAEVTASLQATIDAQPLAYRQVLTLHLLHGLQAKQISE